MEHTRDRNKRIVITVGKKPHTGSLPSTTPEPAKSEAAPKADDEPTRDRLAALAALYRILRG